jgi:hypothetical protein
MRNGVFWHHSVRVTKIEPAGQTRVSFGAPARAAALETRVRRLEEVAGTLAQSFRARLVQDARAKAAAGPSRVASGRVPVGARERGTARRCVPCVAGLESRRRQRGLPDAADSAEPHESGNAANDTLVGARPRGRVVAHDPVRLHHARHCRRAHDDARDGPVSGLCRAWRDPHAPAVSRRQAGVDRRNRLRIFLQSVRLQDARTAPAEYGSLQRGARLGCWLARATRSRRAVPRRPFPDLQTTVNPPNEWDRGSAPSFGAAG